MTKADEGVPQAEARSIIKAAVNTFIDKAPVVGVLRKFFDEADKQHQAERLDAWSTHLAGEQDGDVFAQTLDAALAGTEKTLVRAAVLAGAHAAIDAVDDIVIPTIALLTRLFVKTRTPELRAYRELLTLLEKMDAEVFIAMAEVLPKLREAHNGEIVITSFLFDQGPEIRDWNWFAVTRRPDANPDKRDAVTTRLLTGEIARRTVSTLVGGYRGAFQQDTFPRKDEPRRLVSSDSAPRPEFSPEMIELLTSIWYLPPSPQAG